tara:strand:+ start:22297 stop:22770 length:474 start_codon:yes stop_codon:yes gene_type:complete
MRFHHQIMSLFAVLGMLCVPMFASQAEAKTSFRRHVWPTFKRYCRSCHSSRKERKKVKGKKVKVKVPPAGGLDLSKRKIAYKSLVNQLSKQTKSEYYLVMPSQPAFSYLLLKLQGNHTKVGGKGKKCPQAKGKRKAKKIARWRFNRIVKWIQGGAKK